MVASGCAQTLGAVKHSGLVLATDNEEHSIGGARPQNSSGASVACRRWCKRGGHLAFDLGGSPGSA